MSSLFTMDSLYKKGEIQHMVLHQIISFTEKSSFEFAAV